MFNKLSRFEERDILISKIIELYKKESIEYYLEETADLYAKIDEDEKALSYYEKYYIENPEDIYVLETISEIYQKINQPDKAKEYYNKYTELLKKRFAEDPKYIKRLRKLAKSFLENENNIEIDLEKRMKAVGDIYKRVLILNPNDHEANKFFNK